MRTPPDLPDAVATILAEATPEAAARLLEIAEGEDRKLAKAARRALFLLRQRGIEPPPPSRRTDAEPSRPSHREAIAYLAYSGPGRAHMLLLPTDTPRLWSIVLLASDGRLVECRPRATTLAAVERELQREGKPGFDGMLKLSVDYARYFLEQGVRVIQERGGLIPLGYHDVVSCLPPAERAQTRHPLWDVVPEETVAEDRLNQYPVSSLRPLFEPLLQGLPEEPLAACAERVREALNSPITLTDEQRARYVRRLIAEAVDSLFSSDQVARVIRCLEFDAFVAWNRDHQEAARLMAHHAAAGRRAASPHEWYLARALTEYKVMERVREALQGERRQTGASGDEGTEAGPRIIVPGR